MSRPTAESTTVHTAQLHSSTLTMGVNEHQELDWRYLSTTDAYSSEYSSQDEYDDEDEYLQDDVVIPPISHPPQGRTRPLLVSSRSSSGAFPSGSSPSQALSSSHASNVAAEADDSTDTIKSMRARALDKINGRGTTTSRTPTEYATPPRGSSTGPAKTNMNGINNTKRCTAAGPSGTSNSTRPSLSAPHQEERASGQSGKLKRRSFGERSTPLKITTKFDQDSQQPTNSPSVIRKRNSGSFKSQQVLLTSEDEGPPGNGYQDKARLPASGSLLLSELKALKARVQELEMERMNRSLSLSVLSPQLTPQSEPAEATALSHSEKLQSILQKHRGPGMSPLRSPVPAAARDGSIRASTLSRLQPPSTPKSSPITQHVALLQEAFKTFEKAMSSSVPSSQAMSNVVQNAINVNQTIRTLIKADVSLVDSSSMRSLQRASDDQIRSLTEALLGMATQAPFDRTMTPSEALTNGPRPYSPRLSTHSGFDQGQRLSLGMVGQELGALEPYSSRPHSLAAESVGSIPNMISSGYPSRTNSISSTTSDHRGPALRRGYNSDYAENRQNRHGSLRQYPMAVSSREPSPPHDSQGSGEGSLPLPGHLPASRFATSTPRSTQSPHFATPGLDVGDSDSAVSAQARRQASVRNILARYSQMSPTGPRRDDIAASQDGLGQVHHLEYPSRHQLHPRQSNPRSSAVIVSAGDSLGRSSVRPLSQQDNLNMQSSMSSIHGQLGQGRGSIRNTRPVFSEDEGGWGTVSVGQLDPRSRPAYMHQARYQQEDDQGYPVGYLERSFQAHKGSDGEGPMRQQMMRQRQQQQDMAMTTPSMSSPTSSPSSSSRLEGQSLASSGYGGVDGRYHLSPRGPAHPSTFPRQQGHIGMSNLLEYSNPGTIGRAMAKTVASLGEHAFRQQHALDGLSPQAQAQFGHILAQD